MPPRTITATEAARTFSDVLNQVRYQGTVFDVVRGKEVVARIVPAAPTRGVALAQLDALVHSWPRLGAREALAFERDIEKALGQIRTDEVEWD
jgi:antitoxin (DNA-binding transcriptional repressor) of toxin-antitoxin stability system